MAGNVYVMEIGRRHDDIEEGHSVPPFAFGGWTPAARDWRNDVILPGVRPVYADARRSDEFFNQSPWGQGHTLPYSFGGVPSMPSAECVRDDPAGCGGRLSGMRSKTHTRVPTYSCTRCRVSQVYHKSNELLPAIISTVFQGLKTQMGVEPGQMVRTWWGKSKFKPNPQTVRAQLPTGEVVYVSPRIVGELKGLQNLMECVQWLNDLLHHKQQVVPGLQRPRPLYRPLEPLRGAKEPAWRVLAQEINELLALVAPLMPRGYRHLYDYVSGAYIRLFWQSIEVAWMHKRMGNKPYYEPWQLKIITNLVNSVMAAPSYAVEDVFAQVASAAQNDPVTAGVGPKQVADQWGHCADFAAEVAKLDGGLYAYLLNMDEVQRLGVSDLMALFAGPMKFLETNELVVVGPDSFRLFYERHCWDKPVVRAKMAKTDSMDVLEHGMWSARERDVSFQEGVDLARLVFV